MDLLTVDNLTVQYLSRRGCVTAVDRVSFALPRGQCFGLVGESGSGKSTIGAALMRLLPPNGRMRADGIVLDGEELTRLGEEEMRQRRWRKVSMVFQAAMNALNPVKRVEDQVMEAVRTHLPELGTPEAARQVRQWFARVGIPDNRRRDYPHQYSGGMRQRAVIAMALSCHPALVIADEPTTALDVIVQDQILSLLGGLRQAQDMSILLISHDISVVADVCDRIGVLYAGRMVESGTRREVFEAPAHPYTRTLLAAHITLADHRGTAKTVSISGPEEPGDEAGCCFRQRCPECQPICRQSPPWHWLSRTHGVRCHKGDRST